MSYIRLVASFFVFLCCIVFMTVVEPSRLIIPFAFSYILICLAVIFIRNIYMSLLIHSCVIINVGAIIILFSDRYIHSQAAYIKAFIIYVLYSIGAFALWYLVYTIDMILGNYKEMKIVRDEIIISDLDKDVLPYEEFNVKRKFLLKGASVREEPISYMEVCYRGNNSDLNGAVSCKIKEVLVFILRKDFDIFTGNEESGYRIILQNTNEAECKVIEKKIFDLLSRTLTISYKDIDISYYEITKRTSKEVVV